jgi:hypothetical protein
MSLFERIKRSPWTFVACVIAFVAVATSMVVQLLMGGVL